MPETSTEKVVSVLDAFKDSRTLLGVTELSARAGLTKSTTHRILGMLVRSGCVGHLDKRYFLTPHLFEVGSYTVLSRPSGLRDTAIPYMTELFAQTRQIVHLAVLDGTDVLYVEKIQGLASFRCNTAAGTRRPVHATALGKALLAFCHDQTAEWILSAPLPQLTPRTLTTRSQLEQALARVRKEGLATDSEESAAGQCCLAAPVLGPLGDAVAAISLCYPQGGLNWRCGDSLLNLAGLLSKELSRKPIGPPRPAC